MNSSITRFLFLIAVFLFSSSNLAIFAQVDAVIGQITSATNSVFVRDISGDSRFVVFESNANLSTLPGNKNNADGNFEIFLFDYAQRHIFQITNTKSVLVNTANSPLTNSNIKVEIRNTRPVISNNGRWLAFSSNATTNRPGQTPNTTNPGNFDGNSFTDTMGANPLTQDANLEIWLYQIPAVPTVDLSSGIVPDFVDLSAGTFTQVTNTNPARLPTAGQTIEGVDIPPFISDDNRDASVDDTASAIAFISNRDLVTGGNAEPNDDNSEVFVRIRSAAAGTFSQVTRTPRGTITAPIFNANPSISGNGLRVAFISNGNNPVNGATGGSNTDGNEEVFYANLTATGAPAATNPQVQVTTTTRTNVGDITNVLSPGKRISRDGRFITFESVADLIGTFPNQSSFSTFIFDTSATQNRFREIGPRGSADSGAPEGDVLRFPTFSDYDATGVPASFVFATRLNIKSDGTIPATASDGLNPTAGRPTQVYSMSLANLFTTTSPTLSITRLTKNPVGGGGFSIPSIQPIPSNTTRRITFSLSGTELGAGNFDGSQEAYYLIVPNKILTTTADRIGFFTGASLQRVSKDPVPTPTPTATPSPTPTPSPSPTGSPTPTPTPVTPSAVQGISPGMLAVVDLPINVRPAGNAVANVASNSRRFPLPIELGGVSLTINQAAAGLQEIRGRRIFFVVPDGVSGGAQPITIFVNGVVVRTSMTIVAARPDIFTKSPTPGPNGRARAFNATNRVQQGEPFYVTTIQLRGRRRVATKVRLFLTGVSGVPAGNISIRIRDKIISGTSIVTPPTPSDKPGEYYVDFTLPPELAGNGDAPIVVIVSGGGLTFESRLDDTSPRVLIL